MDRLARAGSRLLVATTNLGFWQLRRLDARQDYNARVVARADEPVVALATAFGALTEGRPPEDLRHVRVTVSGTWDVASEVYLANRSRGRGPRGPRGDPAADRGRPPSVGVAVDRGFVPRVHYLKGDRSAWAPARGEVEVVGSLEVGRIGERGHGSEVDRIDLEALSDRWGIPVASMWIRAAANGSAGWPASTPAEDLGDGPHLSYAVQWFVFTLIGLGGYPLVLYRLARRDPGVA
ncbi:MAG: SURF1-like protein [Acidimicrobiaceae bacterium]|nr:MAG: SURF1-like protein [Acidimicrobiaceae bacterium]